MSKHHHKKKKTGARIMSFLLFVSIAMLSLSVCARTYIVNPKTFSDMFTSKEYVSGLYDDIVEFTIDESKRCSIPEQAAVDAISYDAIYNIEASYICEELGTSRAYSVEAFNENVLSLQQKIVDSVDSCLKEQGIADYSINDVNQFANNITEYVQNKAQFAYLSKLQAGLNIAKVLSVVIAAGSAIVSTALVIALYFTSSKKYRSIRNIVYSFQAAAVFDLVMLLAVTIVRIAKDLVIYPSYLCNAVMSYVNGSMIVVALASAVLVIISLALMTVIWRMKRDEN